ncbi:metallophosphoesterase [Kosmotoga pacifica]|uniref:Phosphoesterase n=1 Tax=Kosmotoga pacifica TaxID=1330330 RepID=A0A0G2ZGC3_9BACT|nr:metallophosphoesterase [Kosmotoga pacifica]AKI97853.1 phosphodiesterase [Kosmotoga pacifica]
MWMVIADTHDNIESLKKAIKLAKEHYVDTIFHCGDIISPFTAKLLTEFDGEIFVVAGNNDGEKIMLKRILGESFFIGPVEITHRGKRIALMHEPFALKSLKDIDYIFYGHTHNMDIRPGKPFIVNPGEACGYLTGKETCLLLNELNDEYKILEL